MSMENEEKVMEEHAGFISSEGSFTHFKLLRKEFPEMNSTARAFAVYAEEISSSTS